MIRILFALLLCCGLARADTITGTLTVTHADSTTAQVNVTGTSGSGGSQCASGQVVYGFAASGALLCVADATGPSYSYGTCPSGQFMTGQNANGTPICAAPPTSGGSSLPFAPPQCLSTMGASCNVLVQSDGGVIIDQRTGAAYGNLLDVRYIGVAKFYVNYAGLALATAGFNGGGGAFTTDASGNVHAGGAIDAKQLIGGGISHSVTNCGTSPSVTGKGAFARITVGTGAPTSCTLTFGSAYATAPSCNAQGSVSGATKPSTTTTSATFSAPSGSFADGEVLHVVCGSF